MKLAPYTFGSILFLVFPSISYGLRYSALSFLTSFLLLAKGKVPTVNFLFLVFLTLFSLMVDLFYLQSSLSLNLGRFIILIFAMQVIDYRRFDSLFFFLIFINFVIIFFSLDHELAFLHAKDLDSIYGRKSGVFVSPPVLAYLASISILISLYRLIIVRWTSSPLLFLSNLIFFSMSLYLLFATNNKTLLGLTIIFSIFLIIRHINFRSFLISFVVFLLAAFFIDQLLRDYYFLYKLSRFIEYGSNSSLNARLLIWDGFLQLWLSSPTTLLFGVPKSDQLIIGNTFDNDYLFFVINYGVVGLGLILFVLGKSFQLTIRNKFDIESVCLLLSLSASFFVGIVSSPQTDVIFLMVYSFLLNAVKNRHEKI